MAAHKYRGRDRRILEKTKKCLELLRDRDLLALSSVRTSKISTRETVLDWPDGPLVSALIALDVRMTAALAEST